MRINTFIFLSYYVILYIQYNFVAMNPLIGQNVRNAEENEFPFVVSLMIIDDEITCEESKHICTGVLTTRRDVAIGEHCIMNEVLEGLYILIGSIDLRSGSKHFLFWWMTYEHWAVRKRIQLEFDLNDVANIRLLHSAPETINPVAISNLSNRRLYTKEVVTAGWGWVNATIRNAILRTVVLKVLTNDECVARISALAQEHLSLDPRQALCTVADPFALLTYGDSGGPLLYNNELIGINKGACPNTVEETHPELVNLHMSMQYYRRFLIEIMFEEEN